MAKKIEYGNLAVFFLFFGISLIEAVRNKNFPSAILFLSLGILSFWVDFSRKK